MEKYRQVLIVVFVVIALLAPTVIAIQAFLKAFSGFRGKRQKNRSEPGQGRAKDGGQATTAGAPEQSGE